MASYLFRTDGPLTWHPGQFLRYTLPHPNPDTRKTTRYFTIASVSFEGVVMLTTRFAGERGSSFKRALQELPVGAALEASGPSGDFVLDDARAQHVFIAGGIGITPYRAILLDLDHRNQPMNVTLLYANRTPDFVYSREIDALAQKHPRFGVRYAVEPERVTEEAIRAVAPDLQKPIFYVSGPEPMVEAYEGLLAGMSIPDAHIKRDYFPGYDWP